MGWNVPPVWGAVDPSILKPRSEIDASDPGNFSQHYNPIRQSKYRLQNVIDNDDRYATIANRLYKTDDFLDLRCVQSWHHLVEQEEFRPGRKRPRDFQFLSSGTFSVSARKGWLRSQFHMSNFRAVVTNEGSV